MSKKPTKNSKLAARGKPSTMVSARWIRRAGPHRVTCITCHGRAQPTCAKICNAKKRAASKRAPQIRKYTDDQKAMGYARNAKYHKKSTCATNVYINMYNCATRIQIQPLQMLLAAHEFQKHTKTRKYTCGQKFMVHAKKHKNKTLTYATNGHINLHNCAP